VKSFSIPGVGVGVGEGGLKMHPVTTNITIKQRAKITGKNFFMRLPPIVQNVDVFIKRRNTFLGINILHDNYILLYLLYVIVGYSFKKIGRIFIYFLTENMP